MTRVLVDDHLRKRLHNFSEILELCDPSGQVLARLLPIVDVSRLEPWEPTFAEEDLQRQEQASENRYTTAEPVAYLNKLGCTDSDEHRPQ
jgi:hypothetical protein